MLIFILEGIFLIFYFSNSKKGCKLAP